MVVYRLNFSAIGFAFSIGISEIILMILNGLTNFTAQVCFIRAFQLDKAGRASGL
jgi:hypothetical protein